MNKSIHHISTLFPWMLIIIVSSLFSINHANASGRLEQATSTPTPSQPPLSTQIDPLWQPLPTPLAGPESYRLRNWTETDILDALAEARFENVFAVDSIRSAKNSKPLSRAAATSHLLVTLLSETRLRFPSLANRKGLLDDLARWKTEAVLAPLIWHSPGHSLKPLLSMLETAFDRGEVQPETVKDWLHTHIGSASYEIGATNYRADNLLGDGRKAWIISISVERYLPLRNFQGALMILSQEPSGKYHLVPFFEDDWRMTKFSLIQISIQDLNGNGRPEIAYNTIWKVPFGWDYTNYFALYEWDGIQFRNLASDLDAILGDPYTHDYLTEDWSFHSEPDSLQSIVANETIRLARNCPMYHKQTTYRWNGRQFTRSSIKTDPLPENSAANCIVAWSRRESKDNQAARDLLAGGLESRASEMGRGWRPAASDDFRLNAEKQTIPSQSAFVHWLDDTQIPWNNLQWGDINNDGVDDWLVLIQMEKNDAQLWAFIRRGVNVLPVKIEDIQDRDVRALTSSWLKFYTLEHPESIHIYRYGKEMIAFRIEQQLGQFTPFVQHFPNSQYNPRPVQSMEIHHDILTVYTPTQRVLYRWDPNENRLAEIQIFPPSQDQLISRAEDALLENGNPELAIPILRHLLIGKIVNSSIGNDDQDLICSYLGYLLGLAYELRGDQEKAIANYFQVWKEHPGSPYALAARRKLVFMESSIRRSASRSAWLIPSEKSSTSTASAKQSSALNHETTVSVTPLRAPNINLRSTVSSG